MSDNQELLRDILNLFGAMGVEPGKGQDGLIMSRVIEAVDGTASPKPMSFQAPRGMCPLCGARDLMSCDCDPNQQLAELERLKGN